MKDIYTLKLHESTKVYNGVNIEYLVTRVPGGWIYQSYVFDVGITSVFIPFNNDMQDV